MRYTFLLRKPFKVLYYRLGSVIGLIKETLFPPEIKDYKKIPVIINNFNRVDSLKQLIAALEKRGYTNISIIDNLSTYPPLIEYYKSCPYTVFRLDKNIGINALWISGIHRKFWGEFFVYTDSDVVPLEECPDDFMLIFLNVLKKHPLARKVGFSLKIDDLPDHYLMKDQVINWEKKFFEKRRDELLYWAPIDTTFALYRPRGKRRPANIYAEAYRTAYPYMARHIPWYIDSLNPDEENRYYMENSRVVTGWTSLGYEAINTK